MSFPPHGVIITAAGNSTRFNGGDSHTPKKKEFELLDDRSVLYYATLPFLSIPELKYLVVTYGEGLKEETEVALDNLLYTSDIPVILVEGGANRQESVLRGLEAIEESGVSIDYLLIHDGARPWVSEALIISTLATATVFGGAAPALYLHDAIKRVNSEGEIVDHIDRNPLVGIQTPQAFRFPEILYAHRVAINSGKYYFDDTEIFSDFGLKVGVCAGERANRKITILDDMEG
ncbi:MAG: IspD/TarI family cytidylyltransferase [Sphaerochaetaceae bacterium]|nr:IspD/TarI family cytidylyltransferase [Sphaerochaetaceae bacterium]HHU88590.1 2-C-methyl-D-erythritol 4-phosphate cytidylyltransferase [Spirochaetales bacterium]